MTQIKDIRARTERIKRGFLNPDELSSGWGDAYAKDIPYLLGKLEAVGIFVYRMMGWRGKHHPHSGACDHCAVDRLLENS